MTRRTIAAEQRPGAFALGAGITLLGTLRALAAAGIHAFALPDADAMPRRSRRYRPARMSAARVFPETLASVLSEVPSGTVLFPCSDAWVTAVASLPTQTRAQYPASVPTPEALEILTDKARFRATLEELRLPHPLTRTLTSVADLDAVPDSTLQTSFLKPAHSQHFFPRFGVKAFHVASRDDAREKLSACLDVGLEMMLQEYIPGPPTNHYFVDGFVDRGGVLRALFVRQRLRMNPPDFGNSTLMVSVAPENAAQASSDVQCLLRSIRYRGIFSAEFKRDERTGTFNFIEVNARPWWYVEFAARCGVNVCELAFKDALEQSVETISHYAVGRRCVFPYYDLGAARAELAAGRIGVLGWARSWIGAYQPVFRWSDPAPAIGEVNRLLRQRLRRVWR
ncbi:MAG: hypothetical protein ACJ785_11535 [Gemmatimonadaceae bacterium]